MEWKREPQDHRNPAAFKAAIALNPIILWRQGIDPPEETIRAVATRFVSLGSRIAEIGNLLVARPQIFKPPFRVCGTGPPKSESVTQGSSLTVCGDPVKDLPALQGLLNAGLRFMYRYKVGGEEEERELLYSLFNGTFSKVLQKEIVRVSSQKNPNTGLLAIPSVYSLTDFCIYVFVDFSLTQGAIELVDRCQDPDYPAQNRACNRLWIKSRRDAYFCIHCRHRKQKRWPSSYRMVTYS